MARQASTERTAGRRDSEVSAAQQEKATLETKLSTLEQSIAKKDEIITDLS